MVVVTRKLASEQSGPSHKVTHVPAPSMGDGCTGDDLTPSFLSDFMEEKIPKIRTDLLGGLIGTLFKYPRGTTPYEASHNTLIRTISGSLMR